MLEPVIQRVAYLVLLVAVAAACDGPTRSSAVPRSLTVTAAVTGPLYQCSAVAGFSDGSTQDVTSQARWGSSDSTVATVSAAGLVTPLANGSALITATYQGVSGSIALAVVALSPPPPGPAPQTYTLSGVVRATPVNETVADVRIEATHGGLVSAAPRVTTAAPTGSRA